MRETFSFLVFGLSLWNARLVAQGLAIEETLHQFQLRDLQLSPDGTTVAFSVFEPSRGDSKRANIWLYSLNSEDLKRCTTSHCIDTHPRWSPDGTLLAFLSTRSGKRQIYLIPINGGEAKPLTDSETDILVFEWSQDGRYLAFSSKDPSPTREDLDDAVVVEFDEKNPRIRRVDVNSGEIETLTGSEYRVCEFAWSHNSKSLIVVAASDHLEECSKEKIYSLDFERKDLKLLCTPNGPIKSLHLSPNGEQISFIGSRLDGPIPIDLYLIPISGGKPKNCTAQALMSGITSYKWQRDGSILAVTPSGFTNKIVTLTPDSEITTHSTFPVTPSDEIVCGEKRCLFVGESWGELPELWASPSPGGAKKVSDFHKERCVEKLIKPTIVSYVSFDGTPIEASLFIPSGYAKGVLLPTIVLIHGGPADRWTDSFNDFGQLLAARGFAVLCPNIRGSVGYGHEFLIMNRGDWGGDDFHDIMSGIDYLIEQGIADPERLGISGWSYGGYMAAWAVTQTGRFKAAISGAPIIDLAFEYGTEIPQLNPYDTWYLGTPYESHELFIQRSPITHVKHVTTPTLLWCGECDLIDPIQQCQQFYRGLRRYGVETQFVAYPREGHHIKEEKHRLDLKKRMLDWFERLLLQGESS